MMPHNNLNYQGTRIMWCTSSKIHKRRCKEFPKPGRASQTHPIHKDLKIEISYEENHKEASTPNNFDKLIFVDTSNLLNP